MKYGVNIMSKLKKLFFSSKIKEILNDLLEINSSINSFIDNFPEIKLDINLQRIELLKQDLVENKTKLQLLVKLGNKKTKHGKLLLYELHNIAVRANRSTELFKSGLKNEYEFSQMMNDIYKFIDKTESTLTQLKNLPYPNIGITVAGYILSFIPFFNLLSIVFGGYMAFSNDRRAQINGLLMILITIALVLLSLYI